jgi:hypothetical protein
LSISIVISAVAIAGCGCPPVAGLLGVDPIVMSLPLLSEFVGQMPLAMLEIVAPSDAM